jgi:hypothetical protein
MYGKPLGVTTAKASAAGPAHAKVKREKNSCDLNYCSICFSFLEWHSIYLHWAANAQVWSALSNQAVGRFG